MSTPTVREMVETMLRAGGYDGLFSDSECGCLLGDLAPCGEMFDDCLAGYRHEGCTPECGLGCEFHVSATKETRQHDHEPECE